MKLLFVFTGGTIGSTKAGDTIAVDRAKPYLLCEEYAKHHPMDFTYDTVEPFAELSENFSGAHIAMLLSTVKSALTDYDGIIVTHGTDTLQYSAAALGYLLGNDAPPVCLVSSNFPIEEEGSNGIDNLFGAISLIESGEHRGVFVIYRNNVDSDILVHRGTRLSAGFAFSDDMLAVKECPYGLVRADGSVVKNPAYNEKEDALGVPKVIALSEKDSGILRVFPYPGMTYPPIEENTRAILLDTYHSGTVDAKGEPTHGFLAEARRRGIPVYVTGMLGDATYDSTHIFDEFGVVRLPRISPIAAYMKLWMYAEEENLPSLLLSPRGGDIF